MCFLAAQQDELHAELGEESDTLSEESSPQPLGEAIARPSPPPESDGETGNPPKACGGHVVVAIVPPTPSILIHSCRLVVLSSVELLTFVGAHFLLIMWVPFVHRINFNEL